MLGNAGAIDDRQDVDCDQGLNENHRTRQLLKVLAISDVVIYKSRAERLHTDLFYFMGDASKAYNEHFSSELQKVFCYQNITRTIYKNEIAPRLMIRMKLIILYHRKYFDYNYALIPWCVYRIYVAVLLYARHKSIICIFY